MTEYNDLLQRYGVRLTGVVEGRIEDLNAGRGLEDGKAGGEGGLDELKAINERAIKLIRSNIDFSSLLRDLPDWEDLDVEALTDTITLRLSSSEEFQGFSVNDVLESLVLDSLRSYVEAKDTASITSLGRLCLDLDAAGYIDLDDLRVDMDYPLECPGVALALHSSGLVDLAHQLDVQWKENEDGIKVFMTEYMEEVVAGRGAEITALLAKEAFSKSNVDVASRKTRTNTILQKMIAKVIDRSRCGDKIRLGWVGQIQLPEATTAEWKLFILRFMMRHRPNVKISDAFSNHQTWRSSISLEEGVGSLAFGALQGPSVSPKQIAGLITRIICRAEVNWESLLAVVTIALQVSPSAGRELEVELRDLIGEALNSNNTESFRGGLLTARHACLEENTAFSSYAAWFSRVFCEKGSLLSSPSHLQFFFKELTALVPDEPAFALQAQISVQPQVHDRMRTMSEDYRQLARTQLLDVGRKSSAGVPHVLSPAVLQQALEIIAEWNKTGKIPSKVLEASMFRLPLYVSQLVPALMVSQYEGDDLYTAQCTLIETLNARGKVPSHLYREFLSGELEKRYRRTDPQAIDNLSNSESTVSVENLVGCLEVLVNLPLDFNQELESCLSNIRQIIAQLLPTRIQISVEQVERSVPCDLVADVFNALSTTYTQLRHPQIKTKIVNLTVSNNQLLLFSLRHILIRPALPAQLPLLVDVLDANPTLVLRTGESTKLKLFIGSRHHTIDNYLSLNSVAVVVACFCAAKPEVTTPPSWGLLVKLWRLRDWVQLKDSCARDSFTAAELGDALSIQLRLDDILSKHDKILLFKKMFELTDIEVETLVSESLGKVFNEHSSSKPDQSLALLTAIRDFDIDELLSVSAKMVANPRDALQVVGSLEDVECTNHLDLLIKVIEQSRGTSSLLIPVAGVQLVLDTKPSIINSPSVRFSLAYYNAAGLLASDYSSELKAEFCGVYSWFQDSPETRDSSGGDFVDPGLIITDAIKVGLLRLGELFLEDNFCLVRPSPLPSASSVPLLSDPRLQSSIINKLKCLAEKLTTIDERMLAEPVSDWFKGAVSSVIAGATQIILISTFFSELSCSLSFLVENLATLFSRISCLLLSAPERGVLTSAFLRKLGTFPATEVGDVVRRANLKDLDGDIKELLKQFENT